MSAPEHESLPYFREALNSTGVLVAPDSGLLYHYTSQAGLAGILDQGAIRATDVSFFRDTSEYTYGLSFLERSLVHIEAAGYGKAIRPWVRGQIADRAGWSIFVSCFCENGDAAYQWEEYADAGRGVALGLNAAEVSQGGTAPLLRVTYGDESVCAVQERLVTWLIAQLDAHQGKPDDLLAAEAEGVLTAFLATLLLTVIASKGADYYPECEYRLVHLHHRSRAMEPEKLQMRSVNGADIPYVLLPMPRRSDGLLSIASLRAGPACVDTVSRDALSSILAHHGLSYIEVTGSDVTGLNPP